MVLDEKAAEKLYNQLCLIESDEGTYMIAFENESGTLILFWMGSGRTLYWTGSGRTLYWTGGKKAPWVNSAI